MMTMTRTRAAVTLMVVLLGGLAACSVNVGSNDEPPRLYVLTPKSSFSPDLPKVGWQVLIEAPVSAAGLSTARIALQDSPIELRYFGRAAWTDAAPRMVQTLLVESFENSGKIVGVGREQIGLRSDFVLKTELREFQAEYEQRLAEDVSSLSPSTPPPLVRVRLNAKLVAMPRREIVASRNFEQVVTAERNSMEAIIRAFDEALGKVLKSLVGWGLQQGQVFMPERLKGGERS